MTIGGDGQHTYLIHTRNTDGSIVKALMVEDEHRLSERYSDRVSAELIADIQKLLGDEIPDHDALREEIYKALHQVLINVRVPSASG